MNYYKQGDAAKADKIKAAFENGRKAAIEQAVDWLEDNLSELVRDQEMIGTICRYMHKKDNIEQFRKAMQ